MSSTNDHNTSSAASDAAAATTPSTLQSSEADTANTSSARSSSLGHGDADSAADASDIQARIDKKRQEHEQQRAMQRKAFEQQMALLEKQQREEEQTLLKQGHSSTAASAPPTPPNEALTTDPKSAAAAATAAASADQSAGEDLASAVGNLSIGGDQRAKSSLSRSVNTDDANATPSFNEQFLFDDELDNEDSAFVKKYNLNGKDDQFPILVDSKTTPRGADWPKFSGNSSSGAASADGKAAGVVGADVRGAGSVKSRSPPPSSAQGTPGMASAAAFSTSAGRQQQNAFPLPSPSPRLSQTGRNSPAINATAAFAAGGAGSRGPASPSPGLGGLSGEVGRSGGGSRFVNTAVSIPAAAAAAAKNNGGAAFPSFNLGGAFSGASAGSESPSRFGPYSPSQFDVAAGDAARRGSRPNSGFFDAFNPTAGANVPGSLFPSDKYSLGGMGDPNLGPHSALAKHGRKGELDATTQLEDLQGDIFALCKDQHGCRFLQKKLEESNPAHRDMIFSETFTHFAELMTDPFGNYLCQKMLEYCTDEQRNLIVELVAPELVQISLNMHGTRAVQKMIDFLSTPRQIRSIIVALSMNVVTLIKDLNGNHVVQKCLNRLGAEDNQFIYNAVAAHCVEVATHRHGCCVLQRCIDHASEAQRVQLVAEITYNALTLVQDPFGNYVVQYVLDLSVPRFTDAVVRQFVGNVCLLSVQKFSSNVIEKCIRVSSPEIRKDLIEELLNRTRLEKLLRDSFANYVVQTSLDYADPVQRMRLVECIRPILPVIRNTPYGKRIQSKLQRDNLEFGGGPHHGGGGYGGGGFRGGYMGGYGGGGGYGHHAHHGYHHQQQGGFAQGGYGAGGYAPQHHQHPMGYGGGGPGPGGMRGAGGLSLPPPNFGYTSNPNPNINAGMARAQPGFSPHAAGGGLGAGGNNGSGFQY